MGVNAQTSVPAFTAGQVLTAAQQTEINTGIPVFATTVTRDAAFGGTGEKVLAQGQYAYIEANSQLQVYTGAAWVAAGAGLVRVGGGTLSGSSVAFNNVFSATYDNYLVVVSDLTAAGNFWTTVQMGATTTGYLSSSNLTAPYSATSNWNETIYGSSNGGAGMLLIGNPFLAKATTCSGTTTTMTASGGSGVFSGYLNNSTSYTGFTLAGTTFTAGTVNIYGYALS
jgi:hypothetical protein